MNESQHSIRNIDIIELVIKTIGIMIFFLALRNFMGYSSLVYDKKINIDFFINLLPKIIYLVVGYLFLFKAEFVINLIYKNKLEIKEIDSEQYYIYKKLNLSIIGFIIIIYSITRLINQTESILMMIKKMNELGTNDVFRTMILGLFDNIVILILGIYIFLKKEDINF